jgi:hypothetical protein
MYFKLEAWSTKITPDFKNKGCNWSTLGVLVHKDQDRTMVSDFLVHDTRLLINTTRPILKRMS